MAKAPPSLRVARRNPSGSRAFLSWWCSSALLVAVAIAIPRYAGAQAAVEEYRVKAAFLFHFAQLIDWPANSFGSDASHLSVCTLGEDPFRGELETMLDGKAVNARMLRTIHAKDPQDLGGCQMVFIGAAESKRLPMVLAQLAKTPVLTVGETDDFLEQGGMIRLFVEQDKIRFEVNLNAAEQTGIKISSKLLLLAKTVVGKRNTGE